MRKVWLIVAFVAIVAIGAMYLSGAGEVKQPIQFSHKAHIDKVKCTACHTQLKGGTGAGIPILSDCMDCHEGTQSKDPEKLKREEKLAEYAEKKQEIPWKKITWLASDVNVYFSHRRHVALAKIECAACHGPVGESTELPTRLVKVDMDWCIGCHGKEKVVAAVGSNCNACHR